ncbi:hypothetical protein KW841_07830 [Pseudomonas sp. PDM28]|uniref:hypothetical protein n=1 Tax=Pseudomonas sp. PDM28 TaxID=2854770 RepID=UPI001C46CA46|nr:hypothetical protein [Pseudomonas sp. PDM28]MBV7552252.1 hypothetical protein [Pseudomonas sp. PDM28]
MGDTDSPDFNKARGYLIGFSVTVLLLWYFGADLSSFKLLGNEIKLNENVENVWLVLASINGYLWFRFCHRMPVGGLKFDMAMHELYDRSLISLSARIYKKQMSALVLDDVKAGVEGTPEITMLKISASGRMTYLDNISRQDQGSEESPIVKIREMPYPYRNQIRFALHTQCLVNGAEHRFIGKLYTKIPYRMLAYLVKGYVFVKGALLSPWFADHIVPLILGALAVCVASYKWWQINHAVHAVLKNSFNQLLISL